MSTQPTRMEAGTQERQALVPTQKGILYAGRRCCEHLSNKTTCCAIITRLFIWIFLGLMAGLAIGAVADTQDNPRAPYVPGRGTITATAGGLLSGIIGYLLCECMVVRDFFKVNALRNRTPDRL